MPDQVRHDGLPTLGALPAHGHSQRPVNLDVTHVILNVTHRHSELDSESNTTEVVHRSRTGCRIKSAIRFSPH